MRKLNFSVLRGTLLLSIASLSLIACSENDLNLETPSGQAQGEIETVKSATTPVNERVGNQNNFFYSIDAEDQLGTINITSPNGNGHFNFTWNGVRQVVGGLGWRNTQRISVGYNIGSVTTDNNLKFVGLYGWTRSPLTEFYVCERGPGALFNAASAGTNYTANNHTYVMTKSQRIQQPSIDGTQTFWQVQGRWGGAALNSNNSINVGTHLDNFKGALGADFGLNFATPAGGTDAYMVFGCEAYDYGNNRNNRISGAMNATIWKI
ncbi:MULTISPECIES: glycoside hydrolase family 11 protein [unclassified Polaribacter]|uniref:glycoside hydrolase family 11 protein n=1 Tax=unclassified Polaribacter TaxID=196858 RepID=UPI00140BF818|nr:MULTISPECIES: glycoside hydrolase family 11 protein [unclassified Polaribacter]